MPTFVFKIPMILLKTGVTMDQFGAKRVEPLVRLIGLETANLCAVLPQVGGALDEVFIMLEPVQKPLFSLSQTKQSVQSYQL